MYIHARVPLINAMRNADSYTYMYIYAQLLPIQKSVIKIQSTHYQVRGIYYNVMSSLSTGGMVTIMK